MSDPETNSLESNQLLAGAASLGVKLTPDQLSQFISYFDLLSQWSTKTNLTSVPREQYIERHILDSLALTTFIEQLQGSPISGRVVDVGTGAGLPGIAVAIAYPATSTLLLDSRSKRGVFLEAVVASLNLSSRVKVMVDRAERLAKMREYSGSFDLALSRALAPPPQAFKLMLPLVKPGGSAGLLTGKGEFEKMESWRGEFSKGKLLSFAARELAIPFGSGRVTYGIFVQNLGFRR